MAWRLAQKKLGLRYRMDVVPLDARLVKGSHGLTGGEPPAFLCSDRKVQEDRMKMTSVKERILALLG
jgi:hypothetical protein